MAKFRTAYIDRKPYPGEVFKEPSLTEQWHKQECDINEIMARYNITGLLVDPNNPGNREAFFGDFTNVPDYQEAQNFIIMAGDMFAELPAQLRKRFNNNPRALLSFLADPANRDESIQLGLIPPDMIKEEPIIDNIVNPQNEETP